MKWGLVLIACGACGRVGFDTVEIDGQPSDTDGDGIADAADNCPAFPNSFQDDEDGDGMGDECDPCPPFGDAAANLDSDGDGVGDRCDPVLSTGGDRLVYFNGFNRTPTDAQIDGAWTFSNGQAHTVGSLGEEAAITVAVAGARESTFTHVTIEGFVGASVSRPIGVVHRYNATMNDGVLCVFGIDPGNNEVYALADFRTDFAYANRATAANIGDETVLQSDRNGTGYVCSGSNLATPLSAIDPLLSAPNHVGIFSNRVTGSFDWMMVVTTP